MKSTALVWTNEETEALVKELCETPEYRTVLDCTVLRQPSVETLKEIVDDLDLTWETSIDLTQVDWAQAARGLWLELRP